MIWSVIFGTGLLLAAPALAAPELIAVHGGWGAFADTAQCHAIAKAQPTEKSREVDPYASVIITRDGGLAVTMRLSRAVPKNAPVTLEVGARRFRLIGNEYAAWGRDAEVGGHAAIVAAMRQSETMTLGARDWKGQRFRDAYRLNGAPTAIDAAIARCT